MMKGKSTYFIGALLSFFLSACLKVETDNDYSLSAEDYTSVTAISNRTIDEISGAVSCFKILSGDSDRVFNLCGITIDTSQLSIGKIVLNYDVNTICDDFRRSGTIEVSLVNFGSGIKWKNQGAVLQLVYHDYNVINTPHFLAYKLNGDQFLVSEHNGLGSILTHLHTANVVYKQTSSNTQVTFPDGTSEIWSMSRRISYSTRSGELIIVIDGDTTVNGGTTDVWGINRYSQNFYNTFDKAFSSAEGCSFNKPYSGHLYHYAGTKTIDVTYAVNSDGSPASSNAGCAYGFRITYPYAGYTKKRVVAYW